MSASLFEEVCHNLRVFRSFESHSNCKKRESGALSNGASAKKNTEEYTFKEPKFFETVMFSFHA